MATVNELITALGFKLKPDTMSNVKKIDDGLKTIADSAKKLSGLFAGLKGAVDYFTGTVMKDSQELLNLSKITGFGVESLQKWKYAAEASGISAQSFIGDMEHMRKTLLYTEDDIYRLADQLAGMDRRTASQWASKIGISDETLIMMRKGSKEIKKLMSQAYTIPEKSIKQTAEFNSKLAAMKQNLVTMKNEIFMAVSPVLVDLIQKLQKWIEQNKEFIKLKLKNVIEGITRGFERFVSIMSDVVRKVWEFLESLGLVTENTPEVEKVAKVVTAALIAMVSTNIISGVASLAIGISSIVKAFHGLSSVLLGTKITGALTGFAKTALRALGPILTIIETIMAFKDFATKGVSETIEGWKENWSGWDWINPVKLAGVAGQWVGDKIVPDFNPSTMSLPAGATTTTNNTTNDSHNTLNMYMTTPMQAQDVIRRHWGNPVSPGAYTPVMSQ